MEVVVVHVGAVVIVSFGVAVAVAAADFLANLLCMLY